MAAKKKKSAKKSRLSRDEKKELKLEGELPKKSIRNNENRQLIWFFVIVGLVFASVLVPYFWVEGSKVFEYAGVDWVYEENVDYYHGRFPALTTPELIYNIYLRNDPRENSVPTEGDFDNFKYGAIISTTPEFDKCRGDSSRVMRDLGDFLKTAVGVKIISSGSTDSKVAIETGRRYAVCNTVSDRTLVIIDRGDARVVKNENYSYCYTIYIDDCDDASPVEKFMIESIEGFNARWS